MIHDWLMLQQGEVLYLLIVLTLLGGAFFLPFPEDAILITAGILLHEELIELKYLFPLVWVTIVIGDVILYFIGYYFGTSIFVSRWFRKIVHPSKIKKVQKHLNSNHIIAIFLGRHLFYLRSVTFITCGAVRMKLSKYIIADIVASLISCSIMITLGYYAAENFEKIKKELAVTQIILLILVVATGIWWYIRRRSKLKKAAD